MNIKDLWSGASGRARRAGLLALTILALGVRLIAATKAYPAQGDAGHFVQCGMELAQGNPAGLSPHWSQAPILLVAGAIRVGWDPARALQVLTLAAGVVAVPLLMVFAWSVLESWSAALLAGLLVSTNPALVKYSVNGLAEMPYIALLLAAACLVVGGARSGGAGWRLPLSAVFLGLGVYFRPTESCVSAAILYGMVAVTVVRGRRFSELRALALACLVFIALLTPLNVYTARRSPYHVPSTKIVNLAFGDYGYDSKATKGINSPLKAEEAKLKEMGAVQYLWVSRGAVMRHWIGNAPRAVRGFKELLFAGAFYMGTGWFAAIIILVFFTSAVFGRLRRWLLPAALAFAMPSLFCLSFLVDRWLVPSLPFLLVLVGDAVALWLGAARASRWRYLLVAVVILFIGRNAVFSVEPAAVDWRYFNFSKVAARLRDHGSEQDVLMTSGPHLANYFYTNSPFRFIELPYGTIEETERFAGERHVTLIAFSDLLYSHWPIQRLFAGDAPPPNWQLLERLRFEKEDPRYGVLTEQYLLYRRREASE